MLSELKKQLYEYEIRAITTQNFEQAFDVYGTNQDFFLLVQWKKQQWKIVCMILMKYHQIVLLNKKSTLASGKMAKS